MAIIIRVSGTWSLVVTAGNLVIAATADFPGDSGQP